MPNIRNEDLVLNVTKAIKRDVWNENKYEAFIDELCGVREYQKDAIKAVLRYLLGGEYSNLRQLAEKNFSENEKLSEKYGSFQAFEKQLQFPDQLSASIDLATGTGKSYVMYGIAAIMLAEGVVDRVLVLCPSTTIESGLIEKFEALAGNADLRDLLPAASVLSTPKIINASESIVSGSICVENYHAILAHVRSSIRDSLIGNGGRTLILNDEAHHVANESRAKMGRWKEFLTDEEFGFHYVIGLSGTCYVGNEYFADVIHRFSLRQAMEQSFVKKVQYVAEMPRDAHRAEEEKWQLAHNHHEEIRSKLRAHKLLPLTIVVTKDIATCKEIAERFSTFLSERTGETKESIKEKVLVVYSGAGDLIRLPRVDQENSKVEWIFSVSMLNEGWDVKRVFQIIPHEKRAFESKLLIAQVLGRGLRIPESWRGEQPEVTVFNHDNWASDIRHLVDEVMEFEKRIPSKPVEGSEFDFDLVNALYEPRAYTETHPKEGPYQLFEKGYIELATEQAIENISIEFEEASTRNRESWKTQIQHKTYSIDDIVDVMRQRFEDLEEDSDREYYLQNYPIPKLKKIIAKSLERSGNKDITENIRQKFLQSLGVLQRKAAKVVRYDFEPKEFFEVRTQNRPQETTTASGLKDGKTLFFTEKTLETIPIEYRDFYVEATEQASGYKCFLVQNHYDFKTPLNCVIADHDNEKRFVRELISQDNVPHIESWVKSTSMGFYEIEYFWKKGEHPKRSRFSPDFFIKLVDHVLVVEIKGEEEIAEPSEENKKKYQFAIQHFQRVNKRLKSQGSGLSYKFNFLTPSDFNNYFQSIRDGSVLKYQSNLDVALM